MARQSQDRKGRTKACVLRSVSACISWQDVYKLSDEQLQSLLLLRIQHPTPDNPADPNNPPVALLEFLNYLQVSLEASYISPVAPTTQEPSWNSRLSAPPRASSLGRPSPRLNVNTPQNPSIFPPATPNPVPSTGEQDRQYAGSEGAFLAGIIWGAVSSEESKDAFSLLWSEKEKLWVAVYRLHLTVCKSPHDDLWG